MKGDEQSRVDAALHLAAGIGERGLGDSVVFLLEVEDNLVSRLGTLSRREHVSAYKEHEKLSTHNCLGCELELAVGPTNGDVVDHGIGDGGQEQAEREER